MRAICFILLIALALSSSDVLYHYYQIIPNKRYTVDLSQFAEGYLPAGHSYYFSLPVQANRELYIHLTVEQDAIIDFKVDICPFNYKPSEVEVLNGNGLCATDLQYQLYSDGQFSTYTYPVTLGENVYYVAIHVQNHYSLYYLDVLVDYYYS